MKMAKATERDIEASLDIASIIGELENGYRPVLVFGEDDEELFMDMDSADDLRAVVEKLREIADRGSIFRVTLGMAAVLNPRNEVVDPADDMLALHPRFAALEKDAARYRLLREHRPGLLLDILDEPPNPNERNALLLDREIDARLAALPSENKTSPASGRPDQP